MCMPEWPQIVNLEKKNILGPTLMLRDKNDTIAAIATPIGEGGISVIRISGPDAFAITDKIFQGKQPVGGALSHTIHRGTVVHPVEGLVDDVLVSVFRNPHSYTGEDVTEISCHGGYFVSKKILETVIESGARMADPGEFTQRSFVNGKIDLMQAEAVADLIHSKTALAHRASIEQLSGSLSGSVKAMRQQLIDLCSLLELELDFSEEGIELANAGRISSVFDETITELKDLVDSYRFGKIVRDGCKVVLAGYPNAGKSSLLNVLLKSNRVIVSDTPGTTRDVIEETIVVEGIAFRLVDTAGLRETEDLIEQEGVRRSMDEIGSADLILLLLDSSQLKLQSHRTIDELIDRYGNKTLVVLNKIDIRHPRFELNSFATMESFLISCVDGTGIAELLKSVVHRATHDYDSNSSSVRIQSERHRDLLSKTMQCVISAQSTLRKGMSGEFIAVDLHSALNYLGEIIGLTTPDDVLNNIFSRFCIGK